MKSSVTQVELPFVNPFGENYDNGEPQSVTCKNPSAAWIYLNTIDTPDGSQENNFTISNNITYWANASRITFVGCGSPNWYIPNINPYNYNVVFYSSATSTTYSVNVVEGYYGTSTSAANALLTALNSVTGSSGLTFSLSSVIVTAPDSYTLTASGGSFYFVNTCSAMIQGDTVFNLPISQTPTASKVIGPMPLQYTQYVDICSGTLTKYAKIRSVSSNARGNIFMRAYITPNQNAYPAPLPPWGFVFFTTYYTLDLQYAFRPQETVTSIDIQLYDDHGNLLYIPPSLVDKFRFAITLQVEQ